MSDSFLAVGLDVGGTKIAGGPVALPSGEILSKDIVMTLPRDIVLGKVDEFAIFLIQDYFNSLRFLSTGTAT